MARFFFIFFLSALTLVKQPFAKAQTDSVGVDTVLVLADSLRHSSGGTVTGGEFLPDGGWKVSSTNAMIIYDLKTYISSGFLEITVTHFNPKIQNTFRRHHVLSMYTNHWGEHHQIELLDTDWNFHTGFNYFDGVKLQSATYEDDRRVIVPWDSLSWDLNQTYRLKFVWKRDSIQFFRDDSLILTTVHKHDFLLRYIYLGRDRTISGDYITHFDYQQYPAMVGPVFSHLIVKKFCSETVTEIPQLESFSVSEIYANAVRLKWRFFEPVISRLIYRQTDSTGWDSTRFFEIPRKNFEYAIAGLSRGKRYEARVISKNSWGVQSISDPLPFKTRTTDVLLLKPIQDSFTEDAGIIGPYRNIANMGWLYLMVGEKRHSFLQFPPGLSQGTARKAWLNLHIRNKQGNICQLSVKKAGAEWDENSITWNTQPDIQDTLLSVNTNPQLDKGDWITFLLPPDSSIKTGLNIAITSSDSGWVSLDSKDSFEAQPELIIDYRKTYVLGGKVSFAQREPLKDVLVGIKSIKDSATVYSADTIVTDSNGHFETSLKLGNAYSISFAKEPEKEDLGAISIYDAYLAAATAVGIVEPAEDAKMAADANGDGKITIYDALLIAKTAVGLNAGGMVGHWYFPQVPEVLNETEDSVAISESGVVVGDVDCSWPDASVYSLALQNSGRQNLFQLSENDSTIMVSFPSLRRQRLGAFAIDFSFNSDAFVFRRVHWPVSMQNWSTVRRIHKGRIQLGCFHAEKSSVQLGNLKLIFSKRKNGERFKIVIHRIQLDNRIDRDILISGVEEEKKEPVKDSFSVYPNPFNMSTRIEGNLSQSTPIQLFVFNTLGQLVFSKTIVSHKGRYSFIWKGKNYQNSFVSSGIYYILLKTKTKNFGQKVLFLK